MSYRGKRVAVIVPAHNEEKLITGVIATIPAFVDHIVVVDDGSEDGTLSRLNESNDSRLSIISFAQRNGVGAAIVAGYERALLQGPDIVAVMAGDGQMDPHDLPSLINPLVEGRADYAKGNRFLDPGVKKNMPPIRQVGNILLSVLTRSITGIPVWDSQCGYTAVTVPVLRLLLAMSVCQGYGYPNKILTNLSILRRRVIDVPVRCIYGPEMSDIFIPRYFFRMVFVLASCFLYRVFRTCISRPSQERSGGSPKICLLTSSYPRFKGDIAGAFIRNLCRELAAEGCYFDVVAPDGEGAIPLGDEGIVVHRFQYFWPRWFQGLCYGAGIESSLRGNTLLYFQVPFLFISLLVSAWRFSRRCDSIWSHWLIPSGLVGAILSMITGKQHVATVHSGGLHALRRIPFGYVIARFICRHSRIVTAVSEYSLKELRALVGHGGDASLRAVSLSMGVRKRDMIGPGEKERLREKYGLNGKCVLLYMGRLVEIKGLTNLIKAVGRIENATLVIAGDGPERARLERLAEELQIDAVFCGYVEGPLKEEILSASDLVVYPSLVEASGRTEGSPVAILESLASGKPVIASAVGGIPEIIRDGFNGYLVPAGDVNSLAEKLREITVNGDCLKRLSLGAYESSREYELGRIAPAFKRIFEGVIA